MESITVPAMHDIDSVIAGMYDSVSFEKGSRPDWKRHDEIFATGARMVRITDDGVFEFDNRSYQENVDGMVEAGTLTSFWEAELWRETHLFEEMAHVLSAYEARRSRGGELIGRGVNSIQLFRRDGRWWISAMLWRREGHNVRIPDSVPAARK